MQSQRHSKSPGRVNSGLLACFIRHLIFMIFLYLEFSTKCPCAQVTMKSVARRQTGISHTVCSSVPGDTAHCRCSWLSLFFLAVKMCLGEKFRCQLPRQKSMQFLMGPEKQGSISLPPAPLPSWGHSREIQN